MRYQDYQDIDLLSPSRLVPWADVACHLEDVPEAVREELRRVTAPERHFTRAQMALHAAADWLQARGFDYDLSLVLCARALCFLEGLGLHGGGLRSPGVGTARHEAFAGLGKGRRLASDGAAWTAAISDAAGACRWGLSGDFSDDGGGDLGIWVYPRSHDHISPLPSDHFVPWAVVRGWLADDERRVALRHAARALYRRLDAPSALADVAKAMAAEEPEPTEAPASDE